MFTPRVRFLIIFVAILFGCVELNRGDRSAVLPFMGAVVLIIGHFRHGPIRPAFLALQSGQYERARELVESIRYPNLLSAQSRAYFHWLRGALATVEPADLSVAEKELQQAVDGKLRTSNDRCIATAALAEVVLQSKDFNRAGALLDKAAEIPHNESTAEYLESIRNKIREASERELMAQREM